MELPARASSWTQVILRAAERTARSMQHDAVGVGHILLKLLSETEGQLFKKILKANLVKTKRFKDRSEALLHRRGCERSPTILEATPALKRVLEHAAHEAEEMKDMEIFPEHLVLGILKRGHGDAWKLLDDFGLDLETTRRQIPALRALPKNNGRKKRKKETHEAT